jgi:hypothetical protein
MKDKKKIILIALCVISIFGLLLLALTSCDNKLEASSDNEFIKLNSLELKQAQIPNDITISDGNISGYNIGISYVFTKNIDKQKAIEALKDYLIFFDGRPVHTDSRIVVNINGSWINTSVTYPNGQVQNLSTGYKEIEAVDGVEFAAVSPFEYSRYACVIAKNSVTSDYDVNKVPLKALTSRFSNLKQPTFDLNYNDSLQESNDIWAESYYQAGNGQYKSIMANVRILNDLTVSGYQGITNNDTYQKPVDPNQQVEQPEENNQVVNEVNDNVNQIEEDAKSFSETVKQGFEDFKTNVENNETFRIVTICVSSVVGIALIYVVFLIIRKIWHVIKN